MPKSKRVSPRRNESGHSKYRDAKNALAQPIVGPAVEEMPMPHRPAEEFFQTASGHHLLRVVARLAQPPLRFGSFVEKITGLTLEPWQVHLCDRLEKLTRQTGQKLLIHKPPQFGGSTIVSQCFPAYLMGRDPMHTFREATHNQKHSEEFSEAVQAVIEGPEYMELFPGTKMPKQTNLEEWSTLKRLEARRRDMQPSYRAITIAGAGVGTGAATWCVDDPYSSPDEAYSPSKNRDIRRWHSKLLIPRLTPESNLIVMYHRFQADDYGGWLQKQPGWEIIRYAALADAEEPLDPLGRAIDAPLAPNRYPWEYLNKIREDDPDTFYSLYQGLPSNPEGEVVKRNWFPFQRDYDTDDAIYGRIPAFDPKKIMGFILYWDVGGSARGDENVGTLGCAMPDNSWSWLWQISGKWSPNERDQRIVEFSEKLSRIIRLQVQLEEGIGLGKEPVDLIVNKIRAKGIPAIAIRSVGTKWERANNRQDSFRSAAQAGRIRLYEGDFLKDIGLANQKANCWEPYLREITQLQLKKVGNVDKLVGKDNKWDSGTGLHNGLIKLAEPTLTFDQIRALGSRFCR